MPDPNPTIMSELLAAIERARTSGQTDDEAKILDQAKKFGKSVLNLSFDYADQGDGLGGLSSQQIVKSLGGVIATIMRVTSPNTMSSIDLLGQLNLIVLEILFSEGITK